MTNNTQHIQNMKRLLLSHQWQLGILGVTNNKYFYIFRPYIRMAKKMNLLPIQRTLNNNYWEDLFLTLHAITDVNLSNKKINQAFLNSFFNISINNVEELNLSHNNLNAIPSSITNLTKLKNLYLNDNPIPSLPSSIQNLSASLKVLDLENTIVSPQNISQLRNWLPQTEIV